MQKKDKVVMHWCTECSNWTDHLEGLVLSKFEMNAWSVKRIYFSFAAPALKWEPHLSFDCGTFLLPIHSPSAFPFSLPIDTHCWVLNRLGNSLLFILQCWGKGLHLTSNFNANFPFLHFE